MDTRIRELRVISIVVIVCLLGMQGDAFAQRGWARGAKPLVEQAGSWVVRELGPWLTPKLKSSPEFRSSSDFGPSSGFKFSSEFAPLSSEQSAPQKSHGAVSSGRSWGNLRSCTDPPSHCSRGECANPGCSCVGGYCAR
jgi:hypothetical protein